MARSTSVRASSRRVRSKEHTNATNGPKPGGKRPANDLPSGAQTLKVGGKASLSTKGARVPSEADYPCMVVEDFDGNTIIIPVEHTVWYKIAGTGRSITVDTAGSSYDTVIAVYAGAADAGATVACLDDMPLHAVRPHAAVGGHVPDDRRDHLLGPDRRHQRERLRRLHWTCRTATSGSAVR